MLINKVLGTVVAGVALAAVLPMGTAQAATCKGQSCTGQNPKTAGCGEDAKVIDRVRPGGGGPEVELRSSATCGAAWARIEKADPSWKFKIEYKGGKPQFANASYTFEAYTRMVWNSYSYRACVEMYDGQGGNYTCTKWH
ncbi:DUF2690 domain-containing protein [Streptomyces sp. NPDC046261]|uniref:DUF2690 domain-containing protein n=1 Tax=Streptomyces sp. NPDC046261 TaxID=3157200 RepID=UPI0033C5A025